MDTEHTKQLIWMLYFNWQNKKQLDLIDWVIKYTGPQTRDYHFISRLINDTGSTWILNAGHDRLKEFAQKWRTK